MELQRPLKANFRAPVPLKTLQSKYIEPYTLRSTLNPTYSLNCSPFWGLPYRIPNYRKYSQTRALRSRTALQPKPYNPKVLRTLNLKPSRPTLQDKLETQKVPTVAGDAKGFVASVPPARAWFGVHAGFVFWRGRGVQV